MLIEVEAGSEQGAQNIGRRGDQPASLGQYDHCQGAFEPQNKAPRTLLPQRHPE